MPHNGYKNKGEELAIKTFWTRQTALPNTITVGLYDEQTDQLADAADIEDITTEPTDGSYARINYAFGDDFSFGEEGNAYASFAQKTFDLSNTTTSDGVSAYVDAGFCIVAFQAEGDGGAADHLVLTAPITDLDGNPRRRHLPSVDQLDFGGAFTQL